MRLIDADKLLKALKDEEIETNEIVGKIRKIERLLCIQYINTEPTVDSYKEKYEEIKEAYRLLSEAYEHEVTSEDRPQGEWKYIPEGYTHTNGWECSNCKMCYHTNVPYFGEFHFCPNCGAEMVGGES